MKNRMKLAASVLAGAFTSLAAAAPQIDVFSPQGEAKGVRQVAVRFTEPMVAFGDPRLPDPFDVKCEGDAAKLKGRGRWADARNWAYDFETDLPAGQKCALTLKAGVKSAAGEAVAGRREFGFHTGGPAVMTSLPREGNERIDDEQWFLFAFDAPVDEASLERGGWCEASGIGERIPLKVLSERDKRKLIEADKERAFRLYNVYYKGRRAIPVAQFKIEDKRWKDLPVLGVRCAQRFPAGADVGVVIGPEVKTPTGIQRGTPQRLAFQARPAFIVKFSCERANRDAACLPVSPMRLEFNAPVPREKAAGIRLKREGSWMGIEPKLPPNTAAVESVDFIGPFPEKTRYVVELPRGFSDDAGREPENKASFPLSVGSDENPPLAKFPGRFGILELNAEPLLPVTVRAVEAPAVPGKTVRYEDERRIVERYRSFIESDYLRGGSQYFREGEVSALTPEDKAEAFELPRAGGDRPTEVIGIPLKKPGFYLVELESPRLGAVLHGNPQPYYVATSVLVTNLAVHLKHGRERSMVWVTTLDGGKPAAGARVTVRDCAGRALFEGKTDARGIVDTGDRLPPASQVPRCRGSQALFAFARLGEDLSFTSSQWNEGIAPWNFNVPAQPWRAKPLAIHTVFDRTLLRAGETVSMKHIARAPAIKGFELVESENLPRAAQIVHTGSGDKYRIEAKFDAQGVAEGSWKIPPEAKLGEYRVSWLQRGEVISGASFRVEAYRVPLMRAVLAAPKEPQVRPAATRLDAALSYLAGGPAAFLPVRVRHRVEPRQVAFADYPDFRFGGEPVKQGIESGSVADYWSRFDPDEESPQASPGAVSSKSYTLDAAGSVAIAIEKLAAVDRPASLLVEMEYADPNGEVLASSTRVPLHPAAVYLGIRPEGWAANKKNVRLQLLAVDTAGKPLAGRDVSVEVYLRNSYSHRRRLIGGFYAYDSTTETKRIGSGCSVTTDTRGLAFCTVKPGASGQLMLVARSKDAAGNEALASTSVWVVGGDEWWFEPTNHDRIDLVPEKKRYEPGETAKLQLRMPFRKATVLVTVEREGVIDQKVVELDGTAPVIELPVAGHYGPNVYVSALAVRGRVDPEAPGPYAWLKRWMYKIGHFLGLVDEIPPERDTRPTALVDLTKPAYKLGLAEIRVGRRDYELKVKVAPEREVLRARDIAKVAIEVADGSGKPAAHAEVALAAVDEGLLELKNNDSWDILEAFMGRRPQEVATATAQGQVIGKRHFGRKALPPGGGGGKAGARELFDTLLLWQARVLLDAAGRATVEIPMNDSLSSFRVVAVAHAGAALFGHGATTVRTTQDLMLLSGLPPLVREGDQFAAMFTARNTTDKRLETDFEWKVAGTSGAEKLVLGPGEAKTISVALRVPVNVQRLDWEVLVKAAGAADRMKVTQKVVAVHPVRVYQATLAQLDQPLVFPVERPADAVAGKGGVRVEVIKSLAGELTPVYEFFERYSYVCFEQRASKAIGLGSQDLWRSVAASLPAHLDHDGLVKYFASDWLLGSDALTAYVVQVADAAGYEWPQQGLARMLDGLEAFATGKITRGSALPTADLTVRKLAAIEALARHGRARAQMLDSISVDPPLWPSSALIDWIGILKRVDHVPDGEARLREALSQLRARLNFQGTAMTFSTERSDALWWLMVSADVNANRALLAVLDEPEWREDIGRLVRGTLSRQKKGTWGTTVANAWGVVAIGHFSEAFEKTAASGTVDVRVAQAKASVGVTDVRQLQDLPWPAGRETLSVTHSGKGAPWAIVQSRAAIPLKAPLSSGYAIKRTVTAIEPKVYRVTLEVDAQTDMTWVVVDDPIPAGAAILGSGLGRDSATLTSGEKRAGWTRPAFIERTHEAYRAYFEFVPKGRFSVEYTARLNNPGRFDLPATRVEAMYVPEMFGEIPNAAVEVKP
jgi:alpha-2-macroglobulin